MACDDNAEEGGGKEKGPAEGEGFGFAIGDRGAVEVGAGMAAGAAELAAVDAVFTVGAGLAIGAARAGGGTDARSEKKECQEQRAHLLRPYRPRRKLSVGPWGVTPEIDKISTAIAGGLAFAGGEGVLGEVGEIGDKVLEGMVVFHEFDESREGIYERCWEVEAAQGLGEAVDVVAAVARWDLGEAGRGSDADPIFHIRQGQVFEVGLEKAGLDDGVIADARDHFGQGFPVYAEPLALDDAAEVGVADAHPGGEFVSGLSGLLDEVGDVFAEGGHATE